MGNDRLKLKKFEENVPPVNKGKIAVSAMTTCSFEEIVHTPYSPDLAPSDYILFPSLKKELRDRHFESYESIQAAVAAHYADKDKYYFFDGIEKLFERCKCCIDVRGDYIEK